MERSLISARCLSSPLFHFSATSGPQLLLSVLLQMSSSEHSFRTSWDYLYSTSSSRCQSVTRIRADTTIEHQLICGAAVTTDFGAQPGCVRMHLQHLYMRSLALRYKHSTICTVAKCNKQKIKGLSTICFHFLHTSKRKQCTHSTKICSCQGDASQ